jgi:CheY-like chemotaxis protein
MGEKILIVEDHDATRKNVSRFFQSQGYSVFEASDGLEALNRLNQDSVGARDSLEVAGHRCHHHVGLFGARGRKGDSRA